MCTCPLLIIVFPYKLGLPAKRNPFFIHTGHKGWPGCLCRGLNAMLTPQPGAESYPAVQGARVLENYTVMISRTLNPRFLGQTKGTRTTQVHAAKVQEKTWSVPVLYSLLNASLSNDFVTIIQHIAYRKRGQSTFFPNISSKCALTLFNFSDNVSRPIGFFFSYAHLLKNAHTHTSQIVVGRIIIFTWPCGVAIITCRYKQHHPLSRSC